MAPATALGAEAVAARVNCEAVRERALAYFGPVAGFPGLARYSRRPSASCGSAASPPGALETLGGPARDVAELARHFEERLEGAKIPDRAALLAIATHDAAESTLDPLRRIAMMLSDVPIASRPSTPSTKPTAV